MGEPARAHPSAPAITPALMFLMATACGAIVANLYYAQPLIALEIPKMADGRAYSQARVLRERYAYRGEIRAQGDVLHDLLFNMARCGINAFELRADQDAQDCLRAFADFDLAYQQAADGVETVLQQRRRLAA